MLNVASNEVFNVIASCDIEFAFNFSEYVANFRSVSQNETIINIDDDNYWPIGSITFEKATVIWMLLEIEFCFEKAGLFFQNWRAAWTSP